MAYLLLERWAVCVGNEEACMICDCCYYRIGCKRRPSASGRCDFFLKNGEVGLDDHLDVNPLDTVEYDYEEIKRLFDGPVESDRRAKGFGQR
jgi:hypothetical protein